MLRVSTLDYRRAPWSGLGVSALVGVLLCLGALNIATRAKWHEVEDGVLWVSRAEGVVAAEIADGSAAAVAGVRPGDLLLALNGRAVESPSDVRRALGSGDGAPRPTYTLLRLGRQQMLSVQLAPVPGGNLPLYFLLSAIGIFTLLVGASVRLRRPGDPATLHFFWLCLAFFGTFTFSFSGRLDRLDWFFYWADAVAVLLLAPLFLHFTLVFPERSGRWIRTSGRHSCRCCTRRPCCWPWRGWWRLPASRRTRRLYARAVQSIDRLEPLYLSVCMVGGLAVLVRALSRVRSVTARRQLRWIVWGTALGAGPFAVGYALPYAAGAQLSLPMELSVVPLSLVPLAFASAIVRYRLMDVEVIVKRSLVYTAVVLAIVAIYATLFRLAGTVFADDADRHNWVIALLATLVVVLLARPVKEAIQNALDRAFYRDRYDYRRALVGFARDLNSDLDLARLSERLVTRVRETFLVDRMALMLADEGSGDFRTIRTEGFDDTPPDGLAAARRSWPGWQPGRRWRSTIRGPQGRSPARIWQSGATAACTTSCPARRRGGDGGHGPRAAHQRRAAQQRGHGAADGGRQPGRDRARERPPLPAAPAQGRGTAAAARVQREHRRVARRRPGGGRPRRTHRPVEPRAGAALRPGARRRGRPPARRRVRRAVRGGAPRGAARRAGRRHAVPACRWRAGAPGRGIGCSST